MVGATGEIKDPLVDYRQHQQSFRSRFHEQMISVLGKISPDASRSFPLFDKDKCRNSWNRRCCS
jgi:hypothetical protein